MIKVLRLLLFPFGFIYWLITETRNLLFKTNIVKASSFNLPVISIGNLSSGGTGKTPMTELVLRILLFMEQKPGVVSRGYGRKIPGYKKVELDTTSDQCGDEPLQIKQKFNTVEVAVCERRVDGIINLIKDAKDLTMIILDDAFQHRAVKPSLSILTTTFEDPFFSDFILPVGNLREVRRNAVRADIIVVTKCPEGLIQNEYDYFTQSIRKYSQAKIFFSKIKYGRLYPVFGNGKPVTDYAGLTILLITGIANPTPLKSFLAEKSNVQHLKYRDHHPFTSNDVGVIADLFNSFAKTDKIIVTTEKDAMRLRSMEHEKILQLKNLPVYFIEIESVIIDEQEKFENLILDHVKKFK